MAVQVADVRTVLGDLSALFASDEVIENAIRDAEAYVGVSETNPYHDRAVKYWAAYLTLLAYSDTVRRRYGSIPSYADDIFRRYRELADIWTERAREAEEETGSLGGEEYPFELTPSLDVYP